MSSTLAFVLTAMAAVAPDRDHAELGAAIARAVDQGAPLFADDADRRKTASLAVAVAFRESSLRLDAVGDHGRSFCAFQIHVTSGGSRALLTDADACASKGVAMLRTSFRACRDHPIAWYAAGPRGCTSPRAQRISRDRMALAKRIMVRAEAAATEVSSPTPTGFRTSIGAASLHANRRPSDLGSRGLVPAAAARCAGVPSCGRYSLVRRAG